MVYDIYQYNKVDIYVPNCDGTEVVKNGVPYGGEISRHIDCHTVIYRDE